MMLRWKASCKFWHSAQPAGVARCDQAASHRFSIERVSLLSALGKRQEAIAVCKEHILVLESYYGPRHSSALQRGASGCIGCAGLTAALQYLVSAYRTLGLVAEMKGVMKQLNALDPDAKPHGPRAKDAETVSARLSL